MSFLVAERVSRRFEGFYALEEVNMSVARNGRHALIGPNGAGKSTLFNILAGQMPLSSGTVWLEGVNITATPLHRRSQAGISRTYQRNNLFLHKTVFENVRLATQAHDRSAWDMLGTPGSKVLVNAAAAEIVERLSLGHVKSKPTNELSYGDQRKVELAIALAGSPKVLLIDEPAAGMGREESREMVRVLAQLPRDITLVIVEHDMDVVSAIAERVTVLQNGRVIADGTWDEVRSDKHVKRAYMGTKKHH